jgi:hypothetical protein
VVVFEKNILLYEMAKRVLLVFLVNLLFVWNAEVCF